MTKPTFSGTIRPEVLQKADKIVKEHLIPGINSRSGLIEYALDHIFKELFKELFKEG